MSKRRVGKEKDGGRSKKNGCCPRHYLVMAYDFRFHLLVIIETLD